MEIDHKDNQANTHIYLHYRRWRRLCFHPSLSVCLLFAKSKIFQVYSLVNFVILSVCLSPTGHNSKPIIIKLYQVVEIVSTEKPILFWGQRSSWGQICKIVIFHPIDLKFEQDLHIASLNLETNYFWGQNLKGQLKVKLLKSSHFIWKVINLHPINLKVGQDLHRSSLNFGKQLLLRSKCQRSTQGQTSKIITFHLKKSSVFIWVTWKLSGNCIMHHWIWKPTILRSKGQRSTQGQTSKIINFNLKNNQFSSDWPELWLRLWILIATRRPMNPLSSRCDSGWWKKII